MHFFAKIAKIYLGYNFVSYIFVSYIFVSYIFVTWELRKI